MSSDCIHGLDEALCDQCTPKAPPAASAAATSGRAVRAKPVRKRQAPRTGRMVSESQAIVDHGAKRIFHLTHLKNLPGILAAGQITADEGGATPVVDLSSAGNRERRRAAALNSGHVVAGYVPFFLAPLAEMWAARLSGLSDERLSQEAHAHGAAEFVMLVSTVGKAGDGLVLANGDAAAVLTRFVPLTTDPVRVPHLDAEQESVAELLIPDALGLEAVTLIGVANDRARAQVRDALRGSGFSPKVSVYPPWFQPVEPE